MREMADGFATEGFVAISPELYHRESAEEQRDDPLTRMGRLRDVNVIRDVNVAFEHLTGIDGVAGDRIGIAGFCMGGRVAYLMASHIPSLKAAVVFYGGNIMVPWGEGEAPFDRTERIACPVLGLFGEQDTNPSPEDVSKIDAEMKRLGKEHRFRTYAGVGHAFMSRTRPGYNEDVAAEAWARCVGWLDTQLSA